MPNYVKGCYSLYYRYYSRRIRILIDTGCLPAEVLRLQKLELIKLVTGLARNYRFIPKPTRLTIKKLGILEFIQAIVYLFVAL